MSKGIIPRLLPSLGWNNAADGIIRNRIQASLSEVSRARSFTPSGFSMDYSYSLESFQPFGLDVYRYSPEYLMGSSQGLLSSEWSNGTVQGCATNGITGQGQYQRRLNLSL